MARFGSLDTQYFDDAGDPLVSGKIYFYETGTTTPKNTYADPSYAIPNANPVILTAAGRQPNIFFDGVAKAILTKSDDTQVLVRDPVGDTASTFGSPWVASKNYNANDVVQGSDGEFYVSLINGNVNNNPVSTVGSWTFLYSVEWSAGTTYKTGSVVTYQTLVYQSLQNANLNKNPTTEPTFWTQFVGLVLTTKGSIAVGNGTTTVTFPVGANGTVLGANSATPSGLEWVSPQSGFTIVRVPRTSNTILGTVNQGNLIDITSGTFTQTFDAAATLASGWFVYIRNSGTGDITLDPNGSETIDGLTSYIMYPGEVRLVQCDGTALRTVVLNTFYRTFTASGTFTKPPGYAAFSGLVWGAGGSGGKGTNGPGTGGGGGACAPFQLLESALGATETITIGAGGASQTTADSPGSAGGTTTLGSLVSAYGGGAGYGINSASSAAGGGGGGVFSAGDNGSGGNTQGGEPSVDVNRANPGFGGGGMDGTTITGTRAVYGGGSGGGGSGTTSGGVGGGSLFGGGGGGGVGTTAGAGAGGTSRHGGSGGAGVRTTSGVNGSAPGGGGGGTFTGTQSGAGARGEVRIWGII